MDHPEISDLWQFARLAVIEYDRSGKIDDWEADHSGDQNQVDRYMLQELTCDLFDWAKGVHRRKQADKRIVSDARERGRSQVGLRAESLDDRIVWVSWPYLELRHVYGLTVAEIAEEKGVSRSTARRRIADEMSDAAETYREKSLTPVNYSSCGDRKFSRNLENREPLSGVCVEVSYVTPHEIRRHCIALQRQDACSVSVARH